MSTTQKREIMEKIVKANYPERKREFIIQMDYNDKDRLIFVGPVGYLTPMGGQLIARDAVKSVKGIKPKCICRDIPVNDKLAIAVAYQVPLYKSRKKVFEKMVKAISSYQG